MKRAFVIVINIENTAVVDDAFIAEEIMAELSTEFDVVSVNPFGGDTPTITQSGPDPEPLTIF